MIPLVPCAQGARIGRLPGSSSRSEENFAGAWSIESTGFGPSIELLFLIFLIIRWTSTLSTLVSSSGGYTALTPFGKAELRCSPL